MRISPLFVLAAVTAAPAMGQTTMYGVTDSNRLVTFSPAAPGLLTGNVAISGLAAGESVLSIDARPLTGELVIMGSASRLYTVDPLTGNATLLGTGFAPPLNAQAEHGFDFNPTVDRIRVVDSAGGNRRLNPVTGGAVATDATLTFAGAGGTPAAVGSAYRFFQFGANAPMGSVRQYIIDLNGGNPSLAEVGSMAGGNASFNAGVCTVVGALGTASTPLLGFDIFGPTDAAFVSLTNPMTNFSSLYSLNLDTGGATTIGAIGAGLTVRDITAIPAPGAAAMIGLAALVIGRRRR